MNKLEKDETISFMQEDTEQLDLEPLDIQEDNIFWQDDGDMVFINFKKLVTFFLIITVLNVVLAIILFLN